MYYQSTRVKFLCAKNQGLDQYIIDDGTDKNIDRLADDDTKFLDSWSRLMERISRSGTASEESNAAMFTLVLNYQRPRINYYLKKLQDAFAACEDTKLSPSVGGTMLSERRLRKQPCIKSRTWTDDHGNIFKIPVGCPVGVDAQSEAAVTGHSFRDIDSNVGAISDKVNKLYRSKDANCEIDWLAEPHESLLKDLMAATVHICKSVRHRSALEAKLRNDFPDTQQGRRGQKTVSTTVQFLSRIYADISTFIEAAEKMRMFQSTSWDRIITPGLLRKGHRLGEDPIAAINGLGITIKGRGWLRYLQKEITNKNFHKLRRQKRFMYAELQVLHQHDVSHEATKEAYSVHPYIGCSLFEQPFSLTSDELLPQSSATLSTAKTILDREISKMEYPQINMRRLMTMPTVLNDGVLVVNTQDKPGFAYVVGGTLRKGQEMTVERADFFKENHIRSKLGLEVQNKEQIVMPPMQRAVSRFCRRCHQPSLYRCKVCRMKYCSEMCQRKNWRRHVFICADKNRPNDVDRLRKFLARRTYISQDKTLRSQFLLDLFSDDHLCRIFGFVNCIEYEEVINLLCIYGNVITTFRSKTLQEWIHTETLGDFVKAWAIAYQSINQEASSSCSCVPWFRQRRAIGLDIPNWKGDYLHQVVATHTADRVFSLGPVDEDSTAAEVAVVSLYIHLFRDFNNIPDVQHSEWTKFGFCFCTNTDQKKRLAKAYVKLAESGVSLDEVAHAWETSKLSQLMKVRGVDVSYLEANGIRFQCPDIDEVGIYRLQFEVNHTLSGRYCDCFKPKCLSYPKHEMNLSWESDGDYGFHGTNAWERWQLLNFYNHVFQHPSFNARRMQEAKRGPNHEAFEAYLESLVPNFQRKTMNLHLADGMYPKIRAKATFPDGRPHCYCFVHNTGGPEGLDWRAPLLVQHFRGDERVKTDEESNARGNG